MSEPQPIIEPFAGDQLPIRDQRSMIGPMLHETVEQVEQAWVDWVAQHGIVQRRLRGDDSTDLRVSSATVVAYVSGGTWVADCPKCRDGIACWPENPRGCCLGCGTIYTVEFPPAADIERARVALGQRVPLDRHWFIQNGETVDQLEAETELEARVEHTRDPALDEPPPAHLSDDHPAKMRANGVR